jgi:hypothetical protein
VAAMTDTASTTEIATVPFHGTYIHTVLVDGEPHVVIRPTILGIGLDYSTQLQKLKTRSWGRVGQNPTRDSAGRVQEMATVDLDTWSMLLANIDENKVKERVKDLVIKYQAESARVLRRYWTEGGAINPRATDEQLVRLDHEVKELQVAKGRAEVLAILRQGGVVDAGYLDACGRRLAGRVLGETPEFDPVTKPLTVSMYLEGKNLTSTEIKSIASSFGRQLKKLYVSLYDEAPPQIDDLVGRHIVKVAQYQERHRPLFDQVYNSLVSTA